MSDGRLDMEKDEHLGIGDGEYDFGFFLHCVKENPFRLMTIETPRKDEESLHDDVKNINMLNALGFE